jgi:hypothetical protein
MRHSFSQIGLLIFGVAMFGVSCYSTGPEVPIGPDTKHDLLIFFKRDATHDQIENFYTEVLRYPSGGEHYPLPGIKEELRVFPVDGYEAIAVKFFANATQTQREDIKSRVRASSLVHKVMENVVPQDIKKVD